jgi:PEP-CTERM motif
MRPVKHVVWALFIMAGLANAQGNLVVNGGFDSGASSWALTNGAILAAPLVGETGFTVFLGNSSLSAIPTASQTIGNLTLGLTYLVAGDYYRSKDLLPGGSPSDPSFGVFMDNVVYFQTVAPVSFNNIYNFSFLYLATSSSAALSLSAQINGTGVSYSIDNITMYPVPEPGTLGLIGVGAVAGAAFFRKCRGK